MPLHSFGSFSADERELRERQNSAKCSQVCPIQLGNHWQFKMVAFLMELQGGFTKFPYPLCLWGSRNISLYYKKRNWPARSSYDIGAHNVKQTPLLEPKKVLLSPLHIILNLKKQFMKKLNPEGDEFKYIQELLP